MKRTIAIVCAVGILFGALSLGACQSKEAQFLEKATQEGKKLLEKSGEEAKKLLEKAGDEAKKIQEQAQKK